MLQLDPEEARVLGSLAEKQLTTPQYYPLTLNALVNACNQSNNRTPVVAYDSETVAAALGRLREKGVARVIHAGGGSRTDKYRHVVDEQLGLDQRELALVTVLLLRGPQTLKELRTRTERMADFDDVDAVERDLTRLASEREEALTVHLERQPGQKEARWATTISPIAATGPAVSAAPRARPAGPAPKRTLRVPPLTDGELDEEQRELIKSVTMAGPASNIFGTLVRHPGLFRKWLPFGGKLPAGKLPVREREIAILRTGWHTRSDYEWGQHVVIARAAGITDAEIGRITEGPDAEGWTSLESAVLRAADELHDQNCVGDATWAALQQHLNEKQMIELVFVIGHYHLVAFALNTFGVEREEGVPGLPG
jgi:uncharacterized protein YceH (UPF0502 family)